MNKLTRYGGGRYSFDTQWCKSEDVARLEASHAELLRAATCIVEWSDYYIKSTHPILIYIDALRAVVTTCRHRQSRGEQP